MLPPPSLIPFISRKLVLHRQAYISTNKPPVLTLNHTSVPEPIHSPLKSPSTSPKKTLTPHQSPVPKRHAPPPPASSDTKTNGSATKESSSPHRRGTTGDVSMRRGIGGGGDVYKRQQDHSKTHQNDNRYSLQVTKDCGHDPGYQPNFGSLPRRSAPAPPKDERSMSSQATTQPILVASEPLSSQDQQFYSLQRPHSFSAQMTNPPLSKPPLSLAASSPYQRRFSGDPPLSKPSLSVATSSSPQRRFSESATRPPTSPDKSPSKFNKSFSENRQRTSSMGSINRPSSYGQNKSSSSSPHSSPGSSYSHSRGSSKERDSLAATQQATPIVVVAPPTVVVAPPPPTLPTSFSSRDATELVETVRKTSGITHRKAQQAVGAVLQFLKNQVPQCEGIVDGLFAALEKAMVHA